MQYRERLAAPIWWWGIAMFFVVGIAVAVWGYLGDAWGIAAGLVATSLVAVVLGSYSKPMLIIDESGVRAGRTHIEWEWVGEVRALDAEQTAHILGPGGTPAAWLLIRPYRLQAIQVFVADPEDPHPYWVVSTKNPQAAQEAARHWEDK